MIFPLLTRNTDSEFPDKYSKYRLADLLAKPQYLHVVFSEKNYTYRRESFYQLNSAWRKTASAIYRRPVDSKIFGSVEPDITDLEEYINAKRKSGVKATLTHVLVLAAARALKEGVPGLNKYIRRGSYSQI